MNLPRILLVAALAASVPATARAQVVVRPPAPLDPARATVRDAVLVLRDSLQGIHAGRAHLRRDYRDASSQALVSRARVMRDACAASARTLPQTRIAVQKGPTATPQSRSARDELLAEMSRLVAPLEACRGRFDEWVRSSDGDAVRGYANRLADEIEVPIRAYEHRLATYLGTQGIRIRPLGSGTPLIKS